MLISDAATVDSSKLSIDEMIALLKEPKKTSECDERQTCHVMDADVDDVCM